MKHLTLNSGHVAIIDPSAVDKALVESLAPAISERGGAIPGEPGLYFDVMMPTREGRVVPGASFFQIAHQPNLSKTPSVMAIACWDKAIAKSSWGQAIGSYSALRKGLELLGLWRDPPDIPLATPWLATWYTPYFTLEHPLDVIRFGRIEQALFVALSKS